MGTIIVSFLLSAAIIISAWQFLPQYSAIPDGQAVSASGHPGVIVTNQRNGAVEHCVYANDNYACTPVRAANK
jgi:hypothetical protein